VSTPNHSNSAAMLSFGGVVISLLFASIESESNLKLNQNVHTRALVQRCPVKSVFCDIQEQKLEQGKKLATLSKLGKEWSVSLEFKPAQALAQSTERANIIHIAVGGEERREVFGKLLLSIVTKPDSDLQFSTSLTDENDAIINWINPYNGTEVGKWASIAVSQQKVLKTGKNCTITVQKITIDGRVEFKTRNMAPEKSALVNVFASRPNMPVQSGVIKNFVVQDGSIGGTVSAISINTGTVANAESDCAAYLKICDNKGICCTTSNLDNPGDDRVSGQTDVYTKQTILGSCANEGSLLGDPKTTSMAIGGGHKEDGWYVVWIKLTLSSGTIFSCPVDGWLDSGLEAAGPTTRIVDCYKSDDSVEECPFSETSPSASSTIAGPTTTAHDGNSSMLDNSTQVMRSVPIAGIGIGAVVFVVLLVIVVICILKCKPTKNFSTTPKVDINDTYGTYDTTGEMSDYTTVEDSNDYYGQ